MTQAAGMPCPVCKVPLTMSERQGVEIDYCPQCRGVWLDRGELDKILERSAAAAPSPTPPMEPQSQGHHQPDYGRQDYGKGGYGHSHGYKKRKKSFLEELFD